MHSEIFHMIYIECVKRSIDTKAQRMKIANESVFLLIVFVVDMVYAFICVRVCAVFSLLLVQSYQRRNNKQAKLTLAHALKLRAI